MLALLAPSLRIHPHPLLRALPSPATAAHRHCCRQRRAAYHTPTSPLSPASSFAAAAHADAAQSRRTIHTSVLPPPAAPVPEPLSLHSSSSSSSTSTSPKTVLIVNKLRTRPVLDAIDAFLRHIRARYPEVRVFHENRQDIPQDVELWQPGEDAEKIDLVITLGGDGTILHASSLFKVGAVPPVLSFSMGTLGFLLPFHVDDFANALESVFQGTATVLYRMRLSCSFYDKDGKKIGDDGQDWQVMNEVALHRGSSPHLNTIDAFVDGQHLTESVSDGLIVSTPTGSTAYSLSAGGPIVHPSLSALVLTPICPRSLSFRPLVFPASSAITLRIGGRSRAAAGVSMDGQVSRVLSAGESVTVRASPHPIPCINRSSIAEPSEDAVHGADGAGKEDDWVRDINNLLQYNATFRSKALLRHSRG